MLFGKKKWKSDEQCGIQERPEYTQCFRFWKSFEPLLQFSLMLIISQGIQKLTSERGALDIKIQENKNHRVKAQLCLGRVMLPVGRVYWIFDEEVTERTLVYRETLVPSRWYSCLSGDDHNLSSAFSNIHVSAPFNRKSVL